MSSFEFRTTDGQTLTSSVTKDGDVIKVTVGDRIIDLLPIGDNQYTTMVNGCRTMVAVAKNRESCYVDVDSVLIELKEPSDDDFGGGGGDDGGEKDKVFAPMPGKIVKLLVEVGDEVTEKQQLVIVEAMKMENPVLCRANGKVKAINFAAGDQVDTDSPIVELELTE